MTATIMTATMKKMIEDMELSETAVCLTCGQEYCEDDFAVLQAGLCCYCGSDNFIVR